MYHPLVTEQEQIKLEGRLRRSLTRYEPDYSWDVERHLNGLLDANTGVPKRALTADEKAFVQNERLLCSLDFSYWCRYAWLLPDAALSEGSLMRFSPWLSQKILLDEISRLELEQYDQSRRGEPQDGILIAGPKARQEGESALAGMLKMHRLTTSPYVKAVTATENDDKRLSLYERDVRTWNSLPWFLRPLRTEPDLQGKRITFGGLDSNCLYEDYMQKSSLAAGEQYLIGHMSEVAQGDQTYIEKLMELDYFPAIPRSWRTLHILESTPAGMGGWWHPFITEEWKGKGRWKVKFIPYYTNSFKYRMVVPTGWIPSQKAEEHARKVEETSSLYLGKTIQLEKEILYWWEVTREAYRKKGTLTFFLTNYPATLEESFQFAGTSIWDTETIEFYRTMSRPPGGSYEIVDFGVKN